jgi:glycerol-3-phosphate dehydrogenase
MVSIIGGKATTCSAMAEQVTDMVCAKFGITTPCVTREEKLPSYRKFFSDQPGGNQ